MSPPPALGTGACLTFNSPLSMERATRLAREWEEFESAYGAELDSWLLEHPDHPQADEVRATVDKHRDIWLRGHRDVMGFAYLTLGVSAAPDPR